MLFHSLCAPPSQTEQRNNYYLLHRFDSKLSQLISGRLSTETPSAFIAALPPP